jgi:hypothetical protein
MYLLRVDDYPRLPMSSEGFEEFHGILEKNDIPYLIGVTPLIAEKPLEPEHSGIRGIYAEESKFLKSIKKIAKPAFHGVTHQSLSRDYHSEFCGLDGKYLEARLRSGMAAFRKLGIAKPDIIIPPFNTFDISNLQAFKKFFKAVTGGPETIKIFGRMPPGNLDGMMYVPSYMPFYGTVSRIRRAVDRRKEGGVKCLTVHWAWDMENGFKETRRLAESLEGKVIKWDLNSMRTAKYWTG